MKRLPQLAAAFLLLPGQALATNTLCDFDGADKSGRYSFEFIGSGEIAMIQVNEPRSMRLASYDVHDFSYRERRVHIVHAGSDKQGFLPAFTLKGSGEHVLLSIAGRSIVGELTCQWQHDA
ncbi:hypothetical protein H9645_05290 [Luteimonas sp. Sa2BVA3]|uniref:Uncharacterized protein n=1 Tax=Luteimonas colneyensis TaxID=2762230 RepID=A0ABR8UHD4_9GAMM|nr:hypothetical protein [Luteimonas colneyensis]MBD7987438.1 hypothetical protein [Luteimonas colneyensis]